MDNKLSTPLGDERKAVVPDLHIGRFDIPEDQQRAIREALNACVFDDYDRLIQLCDALAGAEGVMGLEKRMGDIKARYGRYPQEKWDKNFALKAYFDQKCGCDIDELLAGCALK